MTEGKLAADQLLQTVERIELKGLMAGDADSGQQKPAQGKSKPPLDDDIPF